MANPELVRDLIRDAEREAAEDMREKAAKLVRVHAAKWSDNEEQAIASAMDSLASDVGSLPLDPDSAKGESSQ